MQDRTFRKGIAMNNHSDINTWLEERIREMAEDIKYYVSQGISKTTAIEMVRTDSCLSAMNFERVMELVQ